jgi:hypothetical protein
MDLEFEIYKGKKFSSLLKDIVLNSEDRNRTIEKLIDDLRIMVKSPNDAILIIPLIKEYLDVTVKNDEQLIKLAAIVQRLITSSNSTSEDGGFNLSEEERKELMENADKIIKEMKNPIDPPTTNIDQKD